MREPSAPQDGGVVLQVRPLDRQEGDQEQIPSPVPDFQNQKLRGGPSDLC